MVEPTNSIRVIAYQESGGPWVAQCLEYDISAQGDCLDEAYERVFVAIELDRAASIEINGAPFAGLDKAPAHFFELWEKRARNIGTSHKSFDHTQVEMALAA